MGLDIIVRRIKTGLPVIMADGKDRENEGDLFFAAERMTVQWMAFMIRYTSGIICAPMTGTRAKTLGLRSLTARPTTRFGCKFTMPVDVKKGTTTGVSAMDRVCTLKALADPCARPSDFGKPGHVFPLIAHSRLLRGRQGHTEAAIALIAISRIQQVGVIAELINDDGTMTKGVRLQRFARQHGIPIVEISQIRKSV